MKTYYRITKIEESDLRCNRGDEDDHDWIIQLIRHFGGGRNISGSWGAMIGMCYIIFPALTADGDHPLWGFIAAAVLTIVNFAASAVVEKITTTMYEQGQLPLDCVIPVWTDTISEYDEDDE